MQRFLLFSGFCFHPAGGWCDYVSEHPSMEDAREAAAALDDPKSFADRWAHVVDTETRQITKIADPFPDGRAFSPDN